MNVADYVKHLLPEIIYSVVSTIYLFRLDKLNKELLSMNFGNSFKLMAYENYAPTKFFMFVLVLFGIGCYLVVHRGYSIIREPQSFDEIVSAIMAIVVTIIFLILLFMFINNPILRAILVVCASIIGGAYFFAN